jgi:hypothetical protein
MHTNILDIALVFGPTFLYSLLLCWLFSRLIPQATVIYSASVGMIVPLVFMYFEPYRYWVDVTTGILGMLAGSLLAFWLLQRRLRAKMRPVYVSPCTCSGFSCRGGSWGSCDNGGF